MRDPKTAEEWFRRAKSNLAKAKIEPSDEILYEDLCFDIQQAAEKALKSLCVDEEIIFPKTHDIAFLLDLLENNGVSIPEKIQPARMLTEYAVETRYPGYYEPVEKKEYEDMLSIAEKVVEWVGEELDRA